MKEGVDGRQKEGSGSREAGGAGGDLGGVAQCRHNNISTKAAILFVKGSSISVKEVSIRQ